MVKISLIFPNTDEKNPSLKTASAQIEEWNGWLQTEKSSPGSFELFVYDLWAHAGYKTFKNKNYSLFTGVNLRKLTVIEALSVISLTFLNTPCRYRTFLPRREHRCSIPTTLTHILPMKSPSGPCVAGKKKELLINPVRLWGESFFQVQFVAPWSSFSPSKRKNTPLTSSSFTSGGREKWSNMRVSFCFLRLILTLLTVQRVGSGHSMCECDVR